MNDVQPNSAGIKKTGAMKELDWVKEYRCPVCKRLLMRGKIVTIETRCPKCKKISVINDR